MTLRHLSIVSLPVTDTDRSLAFFRDQLGFEVRRDVPLGPHGGRWVEVVPPGGQTSMTLVTWFEKMPAGSVQGLVLDTADVERTHAELRRRKVEVSEIKSAPWGRYCTLQDPDGNGLVVAEAGAGTP